MCTESWCDFVSLTFCCTYMLMSSDNFFFLEIKTNVFLMLFFSVLTTMLYGYQTPVMHNLFVIYYLFCLLFPSFFFSDPRSVNVHDDIQLKEWLHEYRAMIALLKPAHIYTTDTCRPDNADFRKWPWILRQSLSLKSDTNSEVFLCQRRGFSSIEPLFCCHTPCVLYKPSA